MPTLGSLVLEFGANVAALRRDMEQARQVVQTSSNSIIGLASKIGGAFTKIGGIIVSAFAGYGFKAIVDAGDKLRDLSFATGQTVEQLSFLDFAATQSGSSVESVSQLFARFSKNLNDIANGSGKNASRALTQLGISFEELSGLDLTSQIAKIGEALNSIDNPARRAALGQDIFGKTFRANAALILEGEEGIARLRDRFIELGGVVTREEADKFDDLNDAIGELGVAARRSSREIAGTLAPALAFLLRVTADTVVGVDKGVKSLGERIEEFVIRGATKLNQITAAFERFKFEITGVDRFLKNAEQAEKALDNIDRKARQRRNAARRGREEAGAVPAELNQFFGSLEEGESENETKRKQQAEAREAKRRNDEYKRGVEEVRNYLADVSRERERLFAGEVARQREYVKSLQEAVSTPREKALKELNEYAKNFDVNGDTFGRKAVEVFNELEDGVKSVSLETQQLQSAGEQLGITFSSALEDAIVNFDSIGDVIRGLTQDIARLGVRMLIIEPILKSLKNAFSGFATGGAGGSGGGFVEFVKGLFSGFGGFRAGGGPVAAGVPYVVGERGAELFVPNTSGMILPNSAGGGGVTIVNNTGVPMTGKDRGSVGGRRQIELGVLDALDGAVATGAGSRKLGLSPTMVPR